ncbi:MAG: Alkyl hydroperoxide reductase AhpD [Alphaproteobacteria bacterium MarineAlpha9_Bin4]|nr:alkyl hydroperoxide reductase [Pelagibacterales bacterium]PPR25425.1 MAG: Alkyl hydroperoxide reductase AhpD [Alphaproteobacteria bacterium MarineAlpha9_Bin4]|tara:strand:- start:340 stop:861 length:522 start_codon:yes stop_codon:yes gene_type:complete
MNVSEILTTFPEYAKDIKLNYSKVLNENILDKQQLYSIILISCLATKDEVLKEAALKEVKEHIDPVVMEDVYGAYSIMSMNAIYYRFTHLATEHNYSSMPANLRMQYLSKHKMNKPDFELLCLAVAVIIGCGKCINAHEIVLRENNISTQVIQTAARVASIINAIANIMKVIK